MQNEPEITQQSSYPGYLLYRLACTTELAVHMLSFLDYSSQNHLIEAMNSCSHPFFKPCKAHYLELTRKARAVALRGHILDWSYDEIVQLVNSDPLVLFEKLPYTMNRWQEDTESEPLSALEYAWLAHDENFMVLFEETLIKHQLQGQLESPAIKKRKDELQKRSLEFRTTLAAALKAFAGDGEWGNLEPHWRAAPQWIFGLALYFYREDIVDESKLSGADVFSDKFRAWPRVRLAGGMEILRFCCGRPWCVAVYLSESHTRSKQRTDESNLAELVPSCQIL